VLEDPRRLIEEFQPLVLLALGDVRAVGEKDDHKRQREQPQQAWIEPQD